MTPQHRTHPRGGGSPRFNLPMSSHVELLRRLFDAFDQQDLETIESALSEDVRSHTPGDNALAGTARGRAAVLAQLGRSRELSGGTYRIEVEDWLGGAAHAAVVYRGTAQRAGRALDLRHVALYEIRGGRISEIWFTPLDQAAFDEFWA